MKVGDLVRANHKSARLISKNAEGRGRSAKGRDSATITRDARSPIRTYTSAHTHDHTSTIGL
jgi:hypothetical protein